MLYHVVIVRMLLVTHSAYLEMTITPISFISCDKSHRNIQNRIVGMNAELGRLMTVAIAYWEIQYCQCRETYPGGPVAYCMEYPTSVLSHRRTKIELLIIFGGRASEGLKGSYVLKEPQERFIAASVCCHE